MGKKEFTNEEMDKIEMALQTEEGQKLFHSKMSDYIKKKVKELENR